MCFRISDCIQPAYSGSQVRKNVETTLVSKPMLYLGGGCLTETQYRTKSKETAILTWKRLDKYIKLTPKINSKRSSTPSILYF